jgi:type II secretory pathway pseudopilin PulG
MKKVIYPAFFALAIILNLGIMLVVITPTVSAQSNCACAVCGRSCDDIAKYGHATSCTYYVAPSTASSTSTSTSPGSSSLSTNDQFKTEITTAAVSAFTNWLLNSNVNAEKQKQEAAKAAQAKIEAAKAAQAKIDAAKAAEDKAKADKLNRELKVIPGTQTLSIKSLPNNYDVVISPGSTLERTDTSKYDKHPWIDFSKDIAVTIIGRAKNPIVVYVGIFAANIVAEDIKGAVDLYNGTPVPPTMTIIANAAIGTAKDAASQYATGKVIDKVSATPWLQDYMDLGAKKVKFYLTNQSTVLETSKAWYNLANGLEN